MDYICTSCNYVGPRKKVKPGSKVIEVILWTVFLVPGPFYSLWRILRKHYACPQCGERVMVASSSKAGKKITASMDEELSAENLKNIPFRWQKDVDEYNAKHKNEEEIDNKIDDASSEVNADSSKSPLDERKNEW